MRAWRTRDHRALVEGRDVDVEISPGRGPLRTASGAALERACVYYLLAPDGSLVRSFEDQCWSIDDDLGRSAYLVTGDCLREYVGRVDTSDGEHTYSERIELEGLVLLPDGAVTLERVQGAALEVLAQRSRLRADIDGQIADRVAAIEVCLHDFEDRIFVSFVLGHEDGEWTLRLEDGVLVWRGTWPGEGKHLRRMLDEVLARRYAGRFAGLKVSDAAYLAESWDFH